MAENLKEEVVRMHAQLCSGIAEPNRILIIYSLADGHKCVNDIASELELSQPAVSRHLKILKDTGILQSERDGQQVYYSLTDPRILQALDLLRGMLADILKNQAARISSIENTI